MSSAGAATLEPHLCFLEDKLVAFEETVQSKMVKPLEMIWPTLVEPLERIFYHLNVVWGIVEHLKSVKETPNLRYVFEEVQVPYISLSLWHFMLGASS